MDNLKDRKSDKKEDDEEVEGGLAAQEDTPEHEIMKTINRDKSEKNDKFKETKENKESVFTKLINFITSKV